jgi:hypothetical protein
MRRYLFVAIMFFALGLFFLGWLFVANAHASPFLVCDPQTGVTHYVVTIDGVTDTVPAFDLGDGTVMLKYDLASLGDGEHNCQVKSKNIWGESVAVPFVFTKAAAVVPGRLRIE